MRKFIVSDLHGNGNVYNSIINYLENVDKEEAVTLYINGDLIDEGLESPDILLDVIDRIKNGTFKIVYLAGNHELLMYQAFKNKEKDDYPYRNWLANGGWSTEYGLEDRLSEKDYNKVIDFISNLDVYKKFKEKINNKNIILVHAACPIVIEDVCHLKIKNDNKEVFTSLWARKDSSFIPIRSKIGNHKYFTIAGHTPNINKYGFCYDQEENCLNIDGGSGLYVSGFFDYDRVPLVEVKNNYLKILTFNNNNEIVYGNYFENGRTVPFTDIELEKERKHLNKNLKVKKLVKNEDGVVGYNNWY